MTLVAHAIALAPPAAGDLKGLRGKPLFWSENDGVGVFCSELSEGERLERADVMEHHHVIERVFAAQTCLPIRFGTVFSSEGAALAGLAGRSDALRDALARVAGKSEVAVTLLWRARDEPTPTRPQESGGPGRRYLAGRRERYTRSDERRRRAEELVQRLVAELAVDRPLVWHETCTSEDVAVSLAALVPTNRAAERKRELEQSVARLDDVVGVVNGPWPPYSFVSLE